MAAAAAKAIVSALAALGGWAVLLVALIVVIVVAAIDAIPFGIFISDEAADNDSIPISAIVAEFNMDLSNKLDDKAQKCVLGYARNNLTHRNGCKR